MLEDGTRVACHTLLEHKGLRGHIVLSLLATDKTQGTLSLIFEKVKFVPQMPVSLDITVPGVAFKIVSKNKAEISGNGIVPLTGGKEYEMYSVTGLTGEIVDDNDSSRSDDSISFSLKFGNFPTSYSGVEAD